MTAITDPLGSLIAWIVVLTAAHYLWNMWCRKAHMEWDDERESWVFK